MLLSSAVAERDSLPTGEYYALMLFAIVGMMLMARRRDLLVIFLALEIMSLGVYVLTGSSATSAAGRRGGVQVFRARRVLERVLPLRHRVRVRGRRHDAARRDRHARRRRRRSSRACCSCSAMVLLLVGFAFKVSAVPFHMWTPDAYEGAPTLVTGFMSTGVKAAAFAAFVRVFLSALEPLQRRLGAGALGDRRR